MAQKTTVRSRLLKFEKQDEEALSSIMERQGLTATGAMRWALRFAAHVQTASSDKLFGEIMQEAQQALRGERYEWQGLSILGNRPNKNMRRTKR